MRLFRTLSFALLTLAALTTFFQTLAAQPITESLQKQVWQRNTTMNADGWDVLMPGQGQDTVFHAAQNLAEVVERNGSGLPALVTTLVFQSKQWIPVTRSASTFDGDGHLIDLQSWKWDGSHWQNESHALRQRDTEANELHVELRLWEDGNWQAVHHMTLAAPLQASTAHFTDY